MKPIKCNDGKSRAFTMIRYRQGTFGINTFKCLECGCQEDHAKCSTQADMKDWAKEHLCEQEND